MTNALDKKKELAKKLKVRDEDVAHRYVSSTSYTGNPKDTKKKFTGAGVHHKKMMEGLASPGWQAHSEAKHRARGGE